IAEKLNLPDYSSIRISDGQTNSVSINDHLDSTVSQIGISHGDLIYITFEETSSPNVQDDKTITGKSSAPVDFKQDPVDDFLEKQDGLIKRERDPKFCKHAAKGMCDYCMPLEAVVEAIYEPPQECETDGLTLTLPWNDEQMVDEVAAHCGLIKVEQDIYFLCTSLSVVGMIYTDLTDDGTGLGKVICKRHIDSYFLSSQECCFSATMQIKNPTVSKWSASGKFGSRFVTCVVTGNKDGDIGVAAYQVSNTCAAMVSADIIEPSVDPSVVRVKESTSERYVPEVFYKYKNEYGVNVQESAKPCFPVEYLLVNVTHGFPLNPIPLFISPTSFPVENRNGVETQSLRSLYKHLGLATSGNVHVNSVSDFHLLVFVKGTNLLDPGDFAALARLAISHEEKDAIQLSQSAGWQTLVTIMKSENSNGDGDSLTSFSDTGVGVGSSSSGALGSEWSCRYCTFTNNRTAINCEMCNLPRDS
ncbi:3632_t:CDS:2, partial [Acaulospora colombiana]